MRPKNSKALARGDLNVAVEAAREESTFIGERIFVPFMVADQAAEYPVIPMEVLMLAPDTKRAMRGYYNRSDWEYENGFYATREHGWEEALDDRELKMHGSLIDAEMLAVERAQKIIARTSEIRVATKCNTNANFTNGAVAIAWTTPATAKPLDDINDAVETIRAACGMRPNTIEIPWAAFKAMTATDQVRELLRYTYPGLDLNNVPVADIARLINIPNVLIGDSQYNSAKKGQAVDLTEIWDPTKVLLTITAVGNDFRQPCIGRTFRWSEESGSGENGTIVEQYRTEGNRSDVYRVRNDVDERFQKSYDDDGNVLSDIGKAVSYLMTGVTA